MTEDTQKFVDAWAEPIDFSLEEFAAVGDARIEIKPNGTKWAHSQFERELDYIIIGVTPERALRLLEHHLVGWKLDRAIDIPLDELRLWTARKVIERERLFG